MITVIAGMHSTAELQVSCTQPEQAADLEKGGKVLREARCTPAVSTWLQRHTSAQGAQTNLALQVLYFAALSSDVVRSYRPDFDKAAADKRNQSLLCISCAGALTTSPLDHLSLYCIRSSGVSYGSWHHQDMLALSNARKHESAMQRLISTLELKHHHQRQDKCKRVRHILERRRSSSCSSNHRIR